MNTALLEESQGTLPEGREQRVVTVFYPDAAYGSQLPAAFQRAIAGLGEMEALDPRPWRLDVLQWPEMQAEATHDVACSQVVVVPADESYAGSEFFRRWVERWPVVEGSRLLLVPRRETEATPTRVRQFVQWLQETCTQKGMDFTEGEMPEEMPPSVPNQSAAHRRCLVSPQGLLGGDTLAGYVLEWEKPATSSVLGLNDRGERDSQR